MPGSFMNYFNRSNNHLNFYKCVKLRDYQNDFRGRKSMLKDLGKTTVLRTNLTKRIEKIAKRITDLEKDIEQLKMLDANPDESLQFMDISK